MTPVDRSQFTIDEQTGYQYFMANVGVGVIIALTIFHIIIIIITFIFFFYLHDRIKDLDMRNCCDSLVYFTHGWILNEKNKKQSL